MTVTSNFTAPQAFYQVACQSGNTYTSDSSGLISSAVAGDWLDLQRSGCKYAGNVTEYLPLLNWRLSSGQPLPAAASSAIFGLSYVPATAVKLLGEATSSDSKTDYAAYTLVVPNTYVSALNFNLIVNCHFTSSGTSTSSTIALAAYKLTSAGLVTSSENLVLTTAQTITSSAADYTFAINGAPSSGNLSGGTSLSVLLTGVCATSSGSNTFQINSIRYNLP